MTDRKMEEMAAAMKVSSCPAQPVRLDEVNLRGHLALAVTATVGPQNHTHKAEQWAAWVATVDVILVPQSLPAATEKDPIPTS